MSYSFSVQASTKEGAKTQIASKFDDLVKTQPIHIADVDAAKAAAFSFIDKLADNEEKDISISCHGYVVASQVLSEGLQEPYVTTVSFSFSTTHTARPVEHHPV